MGTDNINCLPHCCHYIITQTSSAFILALPSLSQLQSFAATIHILIYLIYCCLMNGKAGLFKAVYEEPILCDLI